MSTNLNELRRMAGLPLVAESYVEAKKPEGEKPEGEKPASLADGLKDLPAVTISTDKAGEYVSKLLAANISFAVVPSDEAAVFHFATQEDADAVPAEDTPKDTGKPAPKDEPASDADDQQ